MLTHNDNDDSGGEPADGEELDAEAGAEENVTVPCPYCRQPIWEEAVACEHCGSYVSEEDRPRRRPWWVIVGVLLCLMLSLIWRMRRF
jgi:predicted nucleic acid-binding Zn ribbon protein